MDDRTEQIQKLNDNFRQTLIGGKVLITQGVSSLDDLIQQEVMEKVKTFKDFTADNDPHGEHDFGSFTLHGDKFFWKIDYYNKDNPDMGSEDPSNTKITLRILTIMLANEY